MFFYISVINGADEALKTFYLIYINYRTLHLSAGSYLQSTFPLHSSNNQTRRTYLPLTKPETSTSINISSPTRLMDSFSCSLIMPLMKYGLARHQYPVTADDPYMSHQHPYRFLLIHSADYRHWG